MWKNRIALDKKASAPQQNQFKNYKITKKQKKLLLENEVANQGTFNKKPKKIIKMNKNQKYPRSPPSPKKGSTVSQKQKQKTKIKI